MRQRHMLCGLVLVMSMIADTKTVNYQSALNSLTGKSGNNKSICHVAQEVVFILNWWLEM